MTNTARTTALAFLGSLAAISGTAHADPFPTRDQNPLLAGFGIPGPLAARAAADWSIAADLNWATTAIATSMGSETLVVDAETRELRLTIGHSVTNRVRLQVQLPYRYTGAGSLDGFIDTWHDFLGLPEGDRAQLPEDQFRIAYRRSSTTLLDVDSSRTDIGDISFDAGLTLAAAADFASSLWLSLKLPTGDADDLTGSGAVDVALSVSADKRLSDRWSAFGQASVTWLGDGDLLTAQQASFVWSGFGGIAFQATPGLALKVQLDAHSAAYEDSAIDFLGEAVILTVGGDVRFGQGWVLNLGVSEDVLVEASPDVVFVFGLRRDL